MIDYSGPVIRLASLTAEDFYVLLQKIRDVHAFGDPEKYLIPDSAIEPFMNHCSKKIGDAYFRTPRTTITAFINLLAILDQNADAQLSDLLEGLNIVSDEGGQVELVADEDDELKSFKQ